MTKNEALRNLRGVIRAYHRLKKDAVHVSVAVSGALGVGVARDAVLSILFVEVFPFDKLSYVLKRHLYTSSMSGRADAEEGVLLASTEPSYVESYERYVRTHPHCPEAHRRASEALRRLEEKVYL